MHDNQLIRQQLAQLLQKSNAHADLETALKGLDIKSTSIKLPHLPYTIWQLVEHLRITQQDILDFSEHKNYKPLDWPKEYWPEETTPANEQEWEYSLAEINKSLNAFTNLINDENNDLLKPFAHGEGQNLLREAILIIDHLSYHTGQIVLIRRLLDKWEE
ncbi:DinB family protein [Mucilaginibacter sp.]|uniref:DinB family protein n=1 Tax=Mucilaginibacter sp. TaxID=1882438 RepID=UPI003B00130F